VNQKHLRDSLFQETIALRVLRNIMMTPRIIVVNRSAPRLVVSRVDVLRQAAQIHVLHFLKNRKKEIINQRKLIITFHSMH
jgi:hypothetical protein